jgi:hypothetical protein
VKESLFHSRFPDLNPSVRRPLAPQRHRPHSRTPLTLNSASVIVIASIPAYRRRPAETYACSRSLVPPTPQRSTYRPLPYKFQSAAL